MYTAPGAGGTRKLVRGQDCRAARKALRDIPRLLCFDCSPAVRARTVSRHSIAPTDFRSPLVLTMTVIELDLRLTNGRGSRSKRMTYAAVFSPIARKYVSQLAHQIDGLKPQPELVVT